MTALRPTPPEPGASPDDLPVVALVGRPNVGKSTLLAHATGRFAETSNAPGTTLVAERRSVRRGGPTAVRRGRLPWGRGRGTSVPDAALLVDLPGTASLADRPAGSEPFWEMLLAQRPDAVLAIVDAGDLSRHLPLALACRDLGLPLVVAANLADEAEAHGVDVDAGRLSQILAAPVHLTVGRTGRGVGDAVRDAVRLARQRRAVRDHGASPRGTIPASPYPPVMEARLGSIGRDIGGIQSLGAAAVDETGLAGLVAAGALSPRGAASLVLADALEPIRWEVAARWAALVERRLGGSAAEPAHGASGEPGTLVRRPDRPADRLARLATAPWPGLPLFAAVTLLSFVAMMIVGGWLSAILTAGWSATATPAITAAVRTLVPATALANTLLWALDGGLIAMISVGIPYVLTFYVLLALLEDSGYLTSAAVLTDRLFNVVGLSGRAAIPLLAASGCNVPAIYGTRVLATRRERLIASFLVTMTPCSARSAVVIAAVAPFAGPAAALAAFGIVAGLTIAGGVLANRLVPGRQPALVLELAPLRRPILRHVFAKAWARFRAFVRSAAPIMIVGSLVLGALYETGLVWPLAGLADPIVRGWLGLPAVAGLALVFAFLRKELALQLLIALAVVQFGATATNLGSFMSPGQLFVYAIVTSVSVPCVATLAALAAEFGWRAAAMMSGATLALALGTGGLLARLLGIA